MVEKQSESLAQSNYNITIRPTPRSFQGVSPQTFLVTGDRQGARTITWILYIYEADYSIFVGLMWKDFLSSPEKQGTLNRGLHGGRRSHDAQTLSLIEELKHNICYCSRKSLINFDNNTASYYDWILPNIPQECHIYACPNPKRSKI
eukprot:13579755-Ditylum_brightwellii.AAC.2